MSREELNLMQTLEPSKLSMLTGSVRTRWRVFLPLSSVKSNIDRCVVHIQLRILRKIDMDPELLFLWDLRSFTEVAEKC